MEQPLVAVLTVQPTIAMQAGWQSVFQHSWCGTVVVQPRPATETPGDCPVCDRPSDPWWRQVGLPMAGLEAVAS